LPYGSAGEHSGHRGAVRGWALVVCCLVLIATMLLAGARITPYDHLQAGT
jgi:hypothetical protein